MGKKSSMFFKKHTKCCTLVMFTHNIYSHKDVLYSRLQKKEELLVLDDFLGFLSKKSVKEKVAVAIIAVSEVDKIVCSQCKALYTREILLEAQVCFVFISEVFKRTGNFSEEIEAILRKSLTTLYGLTF